MRPSTRALALFALATLLPAAAAADSRFELPRLTAVSAPGAGADVLLVDEDSGRRDRVSVGERYAGRYRLVEVERDRIVLRRLGRDRIYYVLPLRTEAPATRSSHGRDLAPLDPYGEPEDVRRVLAPARARAKSSSRDPHGDRESAERETPQPKDPYAGSTPVPAREGPVAPVKDPYAGGDSPARPREVSRARLDEALADFRDLERQVRLRAEGDGVRIVSLDAGSFIHELGLRRGDLVRRVAGRRVNSVEAAAALYAHVARADRIAVRLERDGRELLLRYRIVP